MNTEFNEDYYERGVEMGISGYSNYRWMPELTIPMCYEISEILKLNDNETILDFGCAKGYVVKGFRLLHKQAYGVDISSYAVGQAPSDVRQYLDVINPGDNIPILHSNGLLHYTWILAKDVLEHVPYESIDPLLKQLRFRGKGLFVVVPFGDGKKFMVPSYELDKTHVIREDMNWWSSTFEKAGFNVVEKQYKMKHLKANWSKWEKGNGFFILK
jgi:SAM-dependent methyltransferase